MATKKKPIYPGKCEVCNTEFTTNDEVFMDKQGNNWIICKDEECYKRQGGSPIEQKQGGGKFQSSKFKLEQVQVIEEFVYKLMDNFDKKYPDKLKDPDVMFESLFRTVSGNFKA